MSNRTKEIMQDKGYELSKLALATISLDSKGIVQWLNSEATRLFSFCIENKQLSQSLFENISLHTNEVNTAYKLKEIIQGIISQKTKPSKKVWTMQAGNKRCQLCLSWEEFSQGEKAGVFLLHFIDISHFINRQDELQLQSEVFGAAGEAAVVVDKHFKVLEVNQAYVSITGFEKEECVGKKLNLYKLLREERKIFNELRYSIVHKGFWNGEVWNVRKSGERFPILLTASRVESKLNKNEFHYVIIFSDITELKLARERLDFLAYHDQLTYLPNRSMSKLRFQHSIQRASRNNEKVGMLFIDLDDFKTINDSLGHSKGDYLLKQLSVRLQRVVRKQDTVARLGGDEFLIILEDVKSPEQMAAVAKKILHALEFVFELGEHERFVGASIGIAMYPDDGLNFDELLKHSDSAMYAAKALGRNQMQFYRRELSERINRRSQLEFELRNALDEKAFSLFYQPQINLATGEVIGVEALIRWKHHREKFISPVEFIPILENTGLIISVGRWVAKTALESLKRWRAQGYSLPAVAINVSAIQLQKDNFVDYLLELLDENGMTPKDIEIEITESVFVDNQVIPKVLQTFHEKGFILALDDFGTGYSSLSYLTRLPFNKIKLDRSFVNDIPEQPSANSMVEALVALAKTLGFEVLAEGVENSDQMQFLLKHGCDEAQGYFIGRPLPEQDLLEFLKGTRSYSTSHPINQVS